MNERIKELAEQYACHTETMTGVETEYIFDFDDLLEFAELIRADEREACAKLCESMGVHPALNVYNGGPDWYKRQKECAAAIRQRGNGK